MRTRANVVRYVMLRLVTSIIFSLKLLIQGYQLQRTIKERGPEQLVILISVPFLE